MDDDDEGVDFTDPSRLSELLRELESAAILVERWVVIQHARFDYSDVGGGSGPHHAAQVSQSVGEVLGQAMLILGHLKKPILRCTCFI